MSEVKCPYCVRGRIKGHGYALDHDCTDCGGTGAVDPDEQEEQPRPTPAWKEGDKVIIKDGSEADGDEGVICYVDDGDIIYVDLGNNCVWESKADQLKPAKGGGE